MIVLCLQNVFFRVSLIMSELIATEISKVHLRHELWIDTGDWWTVFTEKFHQKETKVDVQNELRTKKLYNYLSVIL